VSQGGQLNSFKYEPWELKTLRVLVKGCLNTSETAIKAAYPTGFENSMQNVTVLVDKWQREKGGSRQEKNKAEFQYFGPFPQRSLSFRRKDEKNSTKRRKEGGSKEASPW